MAEKETLVIRWHWYVARPDELLIDCDSSTLLQIAMKKLADTSRIHSEPALQVKSIFVANSNKEGHFHVCILLQQPLDVIRLMTWQLYLMDDVNRSVQNFFRAVNNIPAPSLVISPFNWLDDGVALNGGKFWRSHDAVCFCNSAIHKRSESIRLCPAHQALRGAQ